MGEPGRPFARKCLGEKSQNMAIVPLGVDGQAPTPPGASKNTLCNKGKAVKVIASSIRKGNIIEREDGQLYV
ncbi:MAG: hypothetical protein ACRED2_14325, partial [Methylocella sp.]